MKILKKRAFAFLIDVLLYGMFFVPATKLLAFLNNHHGAFFYIVFLAPFFFRDIVFRNASIGKKIMGIGIFSIDWKYISPWVLLKRSLLMTSVGYLYLWKSVFIEHNTIALFDWERECLETRVVDLKVVDQLKESISKTETSKENKLSLLYDQYLRSIYIQ